MDRNPAPIGGAVGGLTDEGRFHSMPTIRCHKNGPVTEAAGMDVGTLRCPRGDHALEPLTVAGLALDRCAQCGLIWFDERELQLLLRRMAMGREVQLQLRSPTLSRDDSLMCPRCRGPSLNIGTWRKVPLALCSTCGGVCLDAIGLTAMLDLGRSEARPPRRFHLAGEEPDAEDEMGQSVLRALLDLLMGPALQAYPGTIASTRSGLPLPPTILSGAAITIAPVAGSRTRFVRLASPNFPAPCMVA